MDNDYKEQVLAKKPQIESITTRNTQFQTIFEFNQSHFVGHSLGIHFNFDIEEITFLSQ